MKTSSLCFLAFLLLASLPAAAADLPGSYLEQLDSASRVFVGRITAIQPVTDPAALGRHAQENGWGRATIDLTEALLGDDYDTEFIVRMPETNADTGQMLMLQQQVVLATYHVGESGIWIIDRDGFVSEPGGLLDGQNRAQVLRSLHALQTRKWSEPANGLRAWSVVASLVGDDEHFVGSEMMPNPVMLFAVQNVTTNDLYVPTADNPGFVRATVTAEDGRIISADLNTNGPRANGGVFTRKLAPHGIVYLQVVFRMSSTSWFDVAKALHLPPGKFSVVLSCANTDTNSRPTYGQDTGPAWTGELKAPPVQLEILPDAERRRQAEARTAAYRASHPQMVIGSAGDIVSNLYPVSLASTNSATALPNPLEQRVR